MRRLSRFTFQGKITLGITAIILAFGLVSAILVSRSATRSLVEEHKKRGTGMALALSARSVDYLLTLDLLGMKIALDQTRAQSESVEYAFIQDKSGQVLAHTFQGGFPVDLVAVNPAAPGAGPGDVRVALLDTGGPLVYDFAAPVTIGGNILGTARIGLSRSEIVRTGNRLLATIFAITGAGALAAAGLGVLFARRLTRRIDLLRVSAEEMVRGNLDLQDFQTGPVLARHCWDITGCTLSGCPAHGNERHRCWLLAGTLCADHPDGEAQTCEACPVYRSCAGDELQSLAEAFDVMACTLKAHIDELKDTQNVLSRQKGLLKTILDVTPDLVSLQDDRLVYKVVNDAFCTFFHKDAEDILGRVDEDLFTDDQATSNRAEDLNILATGQPLSKQVVIVREKARRWFHILKVPVYNDGRIIGLLLTARDITVLKQYQEQLIQSQKMEDLGKLAGGVAHEINNPLGIILGYAQLLKEDVPQDGQIHEDLETIERQAKVCRKIVADLLGFSRRIESTRSELDLNASLRTVASLVDHTYRQERVIVETRLDEDIPPIVGDEDKLRQVWLNLLGNAFDAISANGQGGRIIISTKMCRHRRRVLVTVADTGSGIDQEDMARIFDPFFTTKPPGSGTGLGLSVSFGIIKDHGGKISAISPVPIEYLQTEGGKSGSRPPGPGTVFIVELPLTADGLPEDECLELGSRKTEPAQ